MHEITIDCRMIKASGIGTYLENTLKNLIPTSKNYRFNLIGNSGDLKSLFDKNKIIECKIPIYSIREQIQILKNIPPNSDLFWEPHINIPFMFSGKLLVTVHDLFHIVMKKFVKGFRKKLYSKMVYPLLRRKAEEFICVSNFTANQLQIYGKVESKRINIIHNGIDQSWFGIKNKSITPPDPYFLYVGNVKPHKNLLTLLNAFELILKKIPHQLIIVGKKDGFITEDLVVFKKAKQLGDKVIFTGYIDEDSLKQYYINAEALIFPSLYEGFGLPPLEAMASGCPAIISNLPPSHEVCENAALYFDPEKPEDIAQQMLNLISNPSLRKDLIIRGLHRAKQFTWENSAKETLKVINRIVSPNHYI